MYYYVSKMPWIAFSVFVLVFLVFRGLTKRTRLSEFDSLGVVNIIVASSVVLLIVFFSAGYVRLLSLIQVITLIFSFYFGIHLTSRLLGSSLETRRRCEIVEMFACDNLRTLNLINTLLLLVITTGILGWLLLRDYDAPDYRVLVSKAHRGLDIVRIGALSIFPLYAIGLYLITKRKTYLFFICLGIIVGAFSGSKAFMLEYIVVFFTLDGLLNGERKIGFYFKHFYIFVIFFAVIVVVKMLWGDTFHDSCMQTLNRVFSSGDIYYYAFVSGDYTELFEQYGLWSYLFHPFTSIVGVRGYEWPVGAQIISTSGLKCTGVGPNPHLPILALVLAKGGYWYSLLFSFLAGCFVCISRFFALRFLRQRRVSPFWRIAVFSVFFGAVSNLYVDIGLFQFALIGTFVVTIALSIFYEFVMGLRYKRREPAWFPKPKTEVVPQCD